ncbi:MAG: diguanylate cyclase, partial [Venatoribacter sp.]
PFHPPIVRVRVRNHMRLVQQRHLLEKLAALDGLTGIPNRRHFDETYLQEWRRCHRSGQPLTLVVIDVDKFKPFNDTLGHAAGDRVLQEVANTLRLGIRRPGDFVARYGGEEFVLLLPETAKENALKVITNIQELLAAKKIIHPASEVGPYVTISLGGATVVPSSGDIDPYFFKSADEALYRAKMTGRNKVCWVN